MLATIDIATLDTVTGGATSKGVEIADYATTGALANYCGSLDNISKGLKDPQARSIVRTQANDCWAGLRHSFKQ